jgi:hypothetical protein
MMDPHLIAVWTRGIERIVAVLLGGMAIYYGFRLFMVVPVETQSDGKIKLPGMSVVLSKAGPGVFFAAFGTLVVLTSLFKPIHLSPDEYMGMFELAQPAAEPKHLKPKAVPRPSTEQEVARVRLAVQTINCMKRLATSGARSLPIEDVELAAREAKLALLKTVWDVGSWGDFEAFKRWAMGQSADTSSPARLLFEDEGSNCPT